MTEEKSVTFTARDVAEALRIWAKCEGVTIPSDARLTLVPHGEYQSASATLTWKSDK